MASYNDHLRQIQEATEEYMGTVKEAFERYQMRLASSMEEFQYGDAVQSAPMEMKTINTVDYRAGRE